MTDRIDYKLRDLLVGEYFLPEDREQRVVLLEELRVLTHAVHEAGWARHTGDWDFFMYVTLRSDPDPNHELEFLTGWQYLDKDHNVVPEDSKLFTACVDYDTVRGLRLEDIHDHTYDIDLELIEKIRFEEA